MIINVPANHLNQCILSEIKQGRVTRIPYLIKLGANINELITIIDESDNNNNNNNNNKTKPNNNNNNNNNATKSLSTTLLHVAAQLGHAEITSTLLSYHANPYTGISYFHPLPQNFINKKVKTNVDWYGRTPLDLAAMEGHREVVQILVDWASLHPPPPLSLSTNSNPCPPSSSSSPSPPLPNSPLPNTQLSPLRPPSPQPRSPSFPPNFVDLIMAMGGKVDGLGTLLLSVVEEGERIEMLDWLVDMGELIEAESRGGWRPIHVAVNNGNMTLVRRLVELGASLLQSKYEKNTPLHIASDKGNLEMVKLLLKGHCQVNSSNGNRDTPLHLAVFNGHREVVDHLIEIGASVDALGEGNATPLHYAAKQGHFEIVKALVKQNTNMISRAMREDNTALHLAILHKHHQIATFLAENGASTTAVNWDGDFPVHIAAKQGNNELVSILLERATEMDTLNTGNREGWTPLMHACHWGHAELVAMLLKANANIESTMDRNGFTALTWAVSAGHKDVVNILLEKGANINHADIYGHTALYYAVENGNLEFVRLILTKAIDVSIGGSALEIAVERGVEMVQLLLDSGVSASNPKALLKAIEKKQPVVATLLLNRGANGDVRKEYTNTSGVVLALYHGFTDLVKLLVDKGGQVNRSILHYAVHLGNADVVDMLLQHPDVDKDVDGILAYYSSFFSAAIMDTLSKCLCDGCNPLHCAVVVGNERIVRALLPKSALFLNSTNVKLATPLHLAVSCRRVEIIKLLIDNGAVTESKDASGLTPLMSAILTTSLPPTLTLYHTSSLPTPVPNPITVPIPVNGLPEPMDIFNPPLSWPSTISSSPSSSIPSPSPITPIPSRAEVVRALVSKGVNVNLRSSYSYPLPSSPPLVFPVPPSLSNLPPPYSSSFFPCSTFSCTPLEHILWNRWATCNSKLEVDWEVVEELMKGDINRSGEVIGSDTLLHQAVLMLDLKAVELLMKGGYNVNALNGNGRTPLQLGEDFVAKCKEKFFLGTQHVEAEFEKVKAILTLNGTSSSSSSSFSLSPSSSSSFSSSFWPPLPFIRIPPSSAHQRKERPKITVRKRKL